jgi:protocatechuate 3,4-dioxygenase beta subunit
VKNLNRRTLIKAGAVAGSLLLLQKTLVGCGSNTTTSSISNGTDSSDEGSVGGTCTSEIPSETAGPYPAHDDSAINCLRFSGIQRSDIRTSLNTGGYSGTATATGLPLTLTLTLTDAVTCTPLVDHAIYLWHCDINGKYSMYSSGVTTQTYLRGVQQTDNTGSVTFNTIFPGCYDGRMTHMHFEIYPSLAQAVDDGNAIKTSQLTFPMAILNNVYNNVSGYSTSKTNLSKISYSTDNVFSDGTTYQMAAVTGDTGSGYTASLLFGI